jgi:hypothetical protein
MFFPFRQDQTPRVTSQRKKKKKKKKTKQNRGSNGHLPFSRQGNAMSSTRNEARVLFIILRT